MLHAITRKISPAFEQCEITHIQREPINIGLARAQHRAYEVALQKLGCQLIGLPEQPSLPDSVFVEDIAVVLPEVTVITNPGAASRKPERDTIIEALRPFRDLLFIEEPGTLDGGDVLVLNKEIFIGLSSRTNLEAVEQMQRMLHLFGYQVSEIKLEGVLHLKSAATRLGSDTLLINPDWVEAAIFAGWKSIPVHPSEAYAANALWLPDGVVYPAAFPRTLNILRAEGFTLEVVDVSELAKAEGAVTCCSLIFTA